MKKIFRTTVFWIVLVFLFRAYVRVFDHNLGLSIGSRFGTSTPVCVTSWASVQLSGFNDQLTAIQTQLNDLTQKLSAVSLSTPASTTSFVTTTSTQVALYYFNQKEDSKLPPAQQINVDSLQPVYRTLAASDDILRDTLNTLIQWNLTANEKSAGYITDFPNKDFHFISSTLQPDGTLVLSFSEVPGFTNGGSARMLIMANSIIKTAMQFSGVKKVEFSPSTLFQP